MERGLRRNSVRVRFPLSFAVLVYLVLFAGCDMPVQEIPPEKLPPVPERCETFSNQHKNALAAAYSSVNASQLQVTKVANEFARCMQDAGLSVAEAKGILKKNEAEARQDADRPGAGGVYTQ